MKTNPTLGFTLAGLTTLLGLPLWALAVVHGMIVSMMRGNPDAYNKTVADPVPLSDQTNATPLQYRQGRV